MRTGPAVLGGLPVLWCFHETLVLLIVPSTLARTSFDSLTKSIYTWSEEGTDRFLLAPWP